MPRSTGRGVLLLLTSSVATLLYAVGSAGVALSRQLMPQDAAFVGLRVQQICYVLRCRILHLLIADRVSLSAALAAVAVMQLWTIATPLREQRPWAWWALLLSGGSGMLFSIPTLSLAFARTWGGWVCAGIAAAFAAGMFLTRSSARTKASLSIPVSLRSLHGSGRFLLALCGVGFMGAGVVIAVIASTTILVTQDLEYAVTNAGYIEAIGYRLPALFAQGRIALGGALVALGVLVAFAALFGQSERALWQSVLVAGLALFGGIVGVHLHVGYTTFTHLAPAFIGAVALAAACVLTAAGSFHSGRTAAG